MNAKLSLPTDKKKPKVLASNQPNLDIMTQSNAYWKIYE
jgi:hypothetical protein